MKIKILGSGCMNCQTLEKRMTAALDELKIEASVEKVQSFQDIVAYGVMSTPALVIDEKVVFQGMVPKVEALKDIVTKFSNAHA